MNATTTQARRFDLKRALRQIPMTLYLLLGMVLIFAVLVGPSKYLKLSNILNVISQCSTGVGIVALASFMAICSTGVDLSLGGIVSLSGMLTAKILTLDTALPPRCRRARPGFC